MSESIKSTLKGGLPLILFGAGLLLLVYFIVMPSGKSPKEPTPEVQTAADQLSMAFSNNENTATELYGDKLIGVTGTIIETGSGEAGQPYVLLQGAGTAHPDIQCIFPSSDVAPVIQSLNKGQNITLIGYCSGGQFKVVLRECRIH